MKGFLLFLFLLYSLGTSHPTPEVPELTSEQALALRNEGVNRHSTFIDGGSACDPKQMAVAEREGYFYFCSDLDTYEEMFAYLEETFTPDQTTTIIASTVVEIDDRFAYQSVGWGSMNDWSGAVGNIVSRGEDTLMYQFIVPVYAGDYSPSEIEIEYKYVPEAGWRINSPARVLR